MSSRQYRSLNHSARRIEASLAELTRRPDDALAAVADVSPEFLALFRRQAELWVELRALWICMLAVSHTVRPGGIAQALLSLAQVSEPIDDRRSGYAVDEVLVGSWVELGQAVVAEPNSASGVADACFLGRRPRS